jgi:hypothetical protein
METVFAELEDVDDSLEGAVIESLEAGVNGLHINLVDGRILLFPDAAVVAIYVRPKTLQ